MTERAMNVLTNPDEAAEMGRKGRERVQTLFDKDRIVAQYEALYANMDKTVAKAI